MADAMKLEVHWTPLAIMQAVMAGVCVTSLVAIAVLSYFVEAPPANESRLDLITGGLMTVGFANVIGFLFGQKEQAAQQERQTALALQAANENKTSRVVAETAIIPGSPVNVQEALNESDQSSDHSPSPSSFGAAGVDAAFAGVPDSIPAVR